MSEDNTTVAVTETQENRAPRGELGVATPALTIKHRWHTEHFKLVGEGRHTFYVVKPGAPSLKAYARQLAKSGDEIADTWLSNKAGENNQKRSAANVTAAKAAAAATKLGRKKSKSGGGKAKPAADAATK
jgi:hypothetical protein